ncbi:MAG: hypothetical protein OXH00_17810 [Candidatus Poribacteria bacterium]|nr:hypothetical protein [Candidatus Poribacteria bacterium]
MNTTTPITLQEIVADFIEDMSESLKATFRNTAKDDLIALHPGWGKGIRNKYNLWHDNALVKSLGVDHPDDASMIIIKAVWKALRESESL